MSQQAEELERLISTLVSTTDVVGPLSAQELDVRQNHVSCGSYSVSIDDVRGFLQDQGLFIDSIVKALPDDESVVLYKQIGKLIVGFISGVTNLFTIRDSNNKPIESEVLW